MNRHIINADGGVEVQFHEFYHRHYIEVSGQLQASAALPPVRLQSIVTVRLHLSVYVDVLVPFFSLAFLYF